MEAVEHEIIFQSDMNHSKKGVKNALFEIRNDKSKDTLSELNKDSISYLTDCFSYAVKQNLGDVDKIEKSLKNVPLHVFDEYDNCDSFCRFKINPETQDNSRHFKGPALKLVLVDLFGELASNAKNFALVGSTQANESVNSMMCKHCPKNISYSTTESADFRWACAVASKNIGNNYLIKVLRKLSL